MNIFLSYKFTGIPLDKLHADIDPIVKILREKHKVYCNLYDEEFYIENHYTTKQIMDHAIGNLQQSDYLVVYVDEQIGEGMLIEAGYAYALKKPILLLIKKDIKSVSLRGISSAVVEYDDHGDLLRKLSEYVIQ